MIGRQNGGPRPEASSADPAKRMRRSHAVRWTLLDGRSVSAMANGGLLGTRGCQVQVSSATLTLPRSTGTRSHGACPARIKERSIACETRPASAAPSGSRPGALRNLLIAVCARMRGPMAGSSSLTSRPPPLGQPFVVRGPSATMTLAAARSAAQLRRKSAAATSKRWCRSKRCGPATPSSGPTVACFGGYQGFHPGGPCRGANLPPDQALEVMQKLRADHKLVGVTLGIIGRSSCTRTSSRSWTSAFSPSWGSCTTRTRS